MEKDKSFYILAIVAVVAVVAIVVLLVGRSTGQADQVVLDDAAGQAYASDFVGNAVGIVGSAYGTQNDTNVTDEPKKPIYNDTNETIPIITDHYLSWSFYKWINWNDKVSSINLWTGEFARTVEPIDMYMSINCYSDASRKSAYSSAEMHTRTVQDYYLGSTNNAFISSSFTNLFVGEPIRCYANAVTIGAQGTWDWNNQVNDVIEINSKGAQFPEITDIRLLKDLGGEYVAYVKASSPQGICQVDFYLYDEVYDQGGHIYIDLPNCPKTYAGIVNFERTNFDPITYERDYASLDGYVMSGAGLMTRVYATYALNKTQTFSFNKQKYTSLLTTNAVDKVQTQAEAKMSLDKAMPKLIADK